MQEIELTRGFVALVDDKDYEKVSGFTWHTFNGKYTKYARRCINRKGQPFVAVFMHQVIIEDKNPSHLPIDHSDHNGLNNQTSNLRVATRQQNQANMKPWKRGLSKFKGVRPCNGVIPRWRATIRVDKKNLHLGVFTEEIKAAKAYDMAAKQHFGEFAFLNFAT